MTSCTTWNPALAATIIAAHAARPGAALPILHALQEVFGYIDDAALGLIAVALNRTVAEIHGVVTFYHDFRRTPPGPHVLKLCRAEACQAMGGTELAAALLLRLQIDWGGSTAQVTVDPVFCLGLCATAPAALLDGEPVGRLTHASLAELVP